MEFRLEPQNITIRQYYECTPEKIELIDGILCGDKDIARKLLSLLIVNFGVQEVVNMIPKELIEQAISKSTKVR